MTDSNFQSTAGQSFRTPINTFVAPVDVVQKSSLMDFAETLAEVNPTLQNFIAVKAKERAERTITKGQLEVLGATPKELIELKKDIEEKRGSKFSKLFLGTNYYMQYGIEKQLAINLGNASEAKTKKFFADYVVDVELPDGTTIQQPLSQFDVNSEEFSKAVSEFQNTSLVDTRGIRPELIQDYLLPKQNLALQKVFNDQEINLANSKINQANTLLDYSVLNSWFSIDNYNDNIELDLIDDNYTEQDRINNNGLSQGEFLALNELQGNVDSMVERGLASSVSPTNMLKIVKTNVLKILDYYESNNLDMDVAYEEIEEYIGWIGNLKVGPKTILKDGTVIQNPLSAYYIKDGEDQIETLLTDVYDKKEKIIKKQNDFEKVDNQRTINNTLNQIDFTKENLTIDDYKLIGNTLQSLAQRFPTQISFLYEQYDLRNFNVDDFFFDLETQFDQGEISKVDALTKLTDVMQALGPNASKEDRTKYNNLKQYLNETEGKSLTQRFPEISNLQKYALKTIGKEKDGVYFVQDQTNVNKLEDLNRELERLTKANGGIDAVIEKDGKRYTIKNWYLGEVRKIKNPRDFGQYVFTDPAYDFNQNVPLFEEEDDGGGEGDGGQTINIQEQKVLTYDTNTKLFKEATINEFESGPTTTIVAINGSVTPAGEELRKQLNIDTYENFNFNVYNRNYQNEQVEETNKNLLNSDLEPSTFSEGGFTSFEIESGDTLSAISNDFGIPMEAIMKANGITNASQIDIGDVLLIPEGVDYTDLSNINFIENLDKTKIITEQEHPYAPVREKHNFQVIYNIAKELGIKYPELVAAQAMEETGFGDTQSAENNFLGLQATPSEVAGGESERKLTTEFRGQGEQVEEADFKTFDDVIAMMMQYKKQWNDNFLGREGIVNANSIQEAIKMLQAEDYATNPDYDKNVLSIIDRAIREGWF